MFVNSMTKEEMADLLVKCYNDLGLFSKVFFPNLFFRPFSTVHDKIFELIDSPYQKIAIAAPRGFGKSSIAMSYTARSIVYGNKKYVIPVSATSSSALEQADNLKKELESNDAIRLLFPNFEAGSFIRDTQDEWITGSGTKVVPRGAGQQIRGRRYGINRPDLFILDDMEDDEGVEVEERRMKLKKWLFSTLMNSVDRGDPNWKIVVIGTVLHEDSLLSNLLRDPTWHSGRFEICDDQYNSTYPDFMSTEAIKELADSFRAQGLLDVFYREYRNIPISIEDQGFPSSIFRYYEDQGVTEYALSHTNTIDTIVTFDPAKTLNRNSANTCITTVSIDSAKGKWYVRDVVNKQLHPDEALREIFDQAVRYNAFMIAPEVAGLDEYLLYPLKNMMAQLGRSYVIAPVKPREPKASKKRSGALVPMYRQGQILHNKVSCGSLERQLMQWPRPDKWDAIDCLSCVIFVCEQYEQYFKPPAMTIADEYNSLVYEAPLPDTWRRM